MFMIGSIVALFCLFIIMNVVRMKFIGKASITMVKMDTKMDTSGKMEQFETNGAQFKLDCESEHKNTPCCVLRDMKKKLGIDYSFKDIIKNEYIAYHIDPDTKEVSYTKLDEDIIQDDKKVLFELEKVCNNNTLIDDVANPMAQYDIDTHSRVVNAWVNDIEKLRTYLETILNRNNDDFRKTAAQYDNLVEEVKSTIEDTDTTKASIETSSGIIQNLQQIDSSLAFQDKLEILSANVDQLMTKEHNLKNNYETVLINISNVIGHIPRLYKEIINLYNIYRLSGEYLKSKYHGSDVSKKQKLIESRNKAHLMIQNTQKYIKDTEVILYEIMEKMNGFIFCNRLNTDDGVPPTNRKISIEVSMPSGSHNKATINFNTTTLQFEYDMHHSSRHDKYKKMFTSDVKNLNVDVYGFAPESHLEAVISSELYASKSADVIADNIFKEFVYKTFKSTDISSTDKLTEMENHIRDICVTKALEMGK